MATGKYSLAIICLDVMVCPLWNIFLLFIPTKVIRISSYSTKFSEKRKIVLEIRLFFLRWTLKVLKHSAVWVRITGPYIQHMVKFHHCVTIAACYTQGA